MNTSRIPLTPTFSDISISFPVILFVWYGHAFYFYDLFLFSSIEKNDEDRPERIKTRENRLYDNLHDDSLE
jgi:hypothetical protein